MLAEEEQRALQFQQTVANINRMREAYERALVPQDPNHAARVFAAWSPIMDQVRTWEDWAGIVPEEWEAT